MDSPVFFFFTPLFLSLQPTKKKPTRYCFACHEKIAGRSIVTVASLDSSKSISEQYLVGAKVWRHSTVVNWQWRHSTVVNRYLSNILWGWYRPATVEWCHYHYRPPPPCSFEFTHMNSHICHYRYNNERTRLELFDNTIACFVFMCCYTHTNFIHILLWTCKRIWYMYYYEHTNFIHILLWTCKHTKFIHIL